MSDFAAITRRVAVPKGGINRAVLLIGPLAVKVPRPRSWREFYYGCLNNINEARFSHQPGACPVLWCAPGGFVSVMRRAIPLTDDEFHALDHAEFCRKSNLVIEAKRDSYGTLNGEVVAVDYGRPWEICW